MMPTPARSCCLAAGSTWRSRASPPGGEVVALDSAGYGAMTIGKPVTVVGPPGVHAAVTVSGVIAVYISAPASSPITLRGLVISNLTSGSTGVANITGADLRIENCSIDGFDYNVGHYGPGTLEIADSRLTRGALEIIGTGGSVEFTVERTHITQGNSPIQAAVFIIGNSHGVIKDSTIEGTGGTTYGIRTNTNSVPPGPVTVLLQNSIIIGHSFGIYSDAGAGSYSAVAVSDSQLLNNAFAVTTVNGGTVALASCRIAHNAYAVTIDTAGGAVYTDGRNWFGYNGADLNGGTTLSGPGGVM